ncbi:hypothetical protein MAR_036507 [Mya arenaria]|uniref:Reverse transcriptase n=1 Tax=Mya arenaria TaxID=6604 RepID=A0ABY7FQ48_MYAAR|nr:hypothetical protein MAR_036507 [Mya arenaria]
MLLRSPQTEQIHMVKQEMNRAKGYQNRRKTHKCASDVELHGRPQCPAVGTMCRGCDNKTKRVHEVLHMYSSGAEALTDGDESCYVEDRSFLGAVNGQNDEQWTINFKVMQERIIFKIDTGAYVTVIPDYVNKLIGSPPVDQPTDFFAGMVVVPKPKNKKNKFAERYYLLPVEYQSLGSLSGPKYFSKLDANSGFYQVKIAEESKLLTKFITSIGRVAYYRLPIGLTSSSEYFQKKIVNT